MGDSGHLVLRLEGDLGRFVPSRRRADELRVALDGTSTLGHLVESVGVPLPEVGLLSLGTAPVAPAHRPRDGDVVVVAPVARPQPLPGDRARFLLDVHLGALARRLRVLGVDAAYEREADDDALAARAAAESRVLLTQDLGLLRRRAVPHAAYVRGQGTAEQLADVLDRFDPPLEPYSRCTSCNATLAPVDKADVQQQLLPGTRRSYTDFSRCTGCGRVFWRGAHARGLDAVVRAAGGDPTTPPPAPSR